MLHSAQQTAVPNRSLTPSDKTSVRSTGTSQPHLGQRQNTFEIEKARRKSQTIRWFTKNCKEVFDYA